MQQARRVTIAVQPGGFPQPPMQIPQQSTGAMTFPLQPRMQVGPYLQQSQVIEVAELPPSPPSSPSGRVQYGNVPMQTFVKTSAKVVAQKAPSYRELVARISAAEDEARHWATEVEAKKDEVKFLGKDLEEQQKKVRTLKRQETLVRAELEDLQNESKRFWANHEPEVTENIDALAAASNAADRLREQIAQFQMAEVELSAECMELDRIVATLESEWAGVKLEKNAILEQAAEADKVLDDIKGRCEERERHLQTLVSSTERETVERHYLNELISAAHARIEAARNGVVEQEAISTEEAVNGWQAWQAACSSAAGEVEALRCELHLAQELLRRRTEERDTWRKVAYQNELHLRAERGDDVVKGLKQLTAACSFHSASAGVDWEASRGPLKEGPWNALGPPLGGDAQIIADRERERISRPIDPRATNIPRVTNPLPSTNSHAGGYGARGVTNHMDGEFKLPEFITAPPDMQPELPLMPLPPMPTIQWPPAASPTLQLPSKREVLGPG